MIKPLSNRVIVRPIEADDVSPGGIFIPEVAKEKTQKGEVIAVGPGKVKHGVNYGMGVEVGDEVLYGKYTGTGIDMDDEVVLILREDDILCVLDKE